MVKVSVLVFTFCLAFVFLFLFVMLWAFITGRETEEQIKEDNLRINSNSNPVNTSVDVAESDNEVDDDEHVDNETEIKSISEYPPCHSFGGSLWLHHTTGDCYEVGTQGPCGGSMTFYQNPEKGYKSFGVCDCDDIVEVKSSTLECESIERPLIYYPDEESCYPVYNQGPCKRGEWLVLNEMLHPICEKNICPHTENEDESSLRFWFSYKGKCYKTLTDGYCPKLFHLRVSKDSWTPLCQRNMYKMCPISDKVSIPTLKCRPGNKLYYLGKCNGILKH